MAIISIGSREIGPDRPCFVIAEAGVNHNGDVRLAKRLIDIAADAGADAVKFQTFKAERLATTEAPKADYQVRTTGGGESQREMLRRLELSSESHRELMRYCRERGILFMSTPFDEESADFLDDLGVTVFKMPSGEITNLPFLSHVARKGKPMIVSTGMSTLDEVKAAVQCLEEAGNTQRALLHCVSNYPANPADVNLRAMHTMARVFNCPVGYSDHTVGTEVALAAVALGACVIEKHVTVDQTLPGPDHQSSAEPEAFKALIRSIRLVESALGHGRKEPASSEVNTARVARKSLVAARDIASGTTLTDDLIAAKRPGTGLSPAMRSSVIGRKIRQAVRAGTLLTFDMFS